MRSRAGRLAEVLEARRSAEDSANYEPIRRGWFVGDPALKQELLEALSSWAGAEHYGQEPRESAEQKAERLMAKELDRKGWKEADLEWRPKGDAFKMRLTRKLRKQTTVTVAWIARRLHMGTRGHVTHLLYWQGRSKPKQSQT